MWLVLENATVVSVHVRERVYMEEKSMDICKKDLLHSLKNIFAFLLKTLNAVFCQSVLGKTQLLNTATDLRYYEDVKVTQRSTLIYNLCVFSSSFMLLAITFSY